MKSLTALKLKNEKRSMKDFLEYENILQFFLQHKVESPW